MLMKFGDCGVRSSTISCEPQAVQLFMLLSVIGDEGLRLYNTWSFDEEEQNKLAPVLNKFEQYCQPKKNVLYERFQFWRSTQQPGEGIDVFVTTLRQKAKTCEFGVQEDSMIRDRIVLGCPDVRVQERLLREPDLTLTKAIDLCRAAEATRAQMRSITDSTMSLSSSPTSVNTIGENRAGKSH